jgi:CHAD domain-containing protein
VRLPSDLLRRSAEEGSRLLALAYLDEIGLAGARLPDPHDSEALHDFRVGLRRMRSCIRAYRSPLKGSVSKKVRRNLRDLTLSTNPGRDIEVQLDWLHRQAERLGPGETEGLAWLIGRLEGRKYESLGRITDEIGQDFVKTTGKLRRRLGTFKVEVRTGREAKPLLFGEVTGQLIQNSTAELSDGLRVVARPEQVSEAHIARISAKRLRYLLEPLSHRTAGAKALVGRLKQLQDVLGHLHDMQVLRQEIESSLAALPRGVSDRPIVARPGLEALLRLVVSEAGNSFASFQADWTHERAARFLIRADEFGKMLAGSAPPAKREFTPAGATAKSEANGNSAPNGQAPSEELPPIPLLRSHPPLQQPLR